eukprot:scaffold331355_cov28-Prasinocladus_malaysianus.AAC.1
MNAYANLSWTQTGYLMSISRISRKHQCHGWIDALHTLIHLGEINYKTYNSIDVIPGDYHSLRSMETRGNIYAH